MRDGIIEFETFGDTYPFTPNYRHVNGFNMHFVDKGYGDPVGCRDGCRCRVVGNRLGARGQAPAD